MTTEAKRALLVLILSGSATMFAACNKSGGQKAGMDAGPDTSVGLGTDAGPDAADDGAAHDTGTPADPFPARGRHCPALEPHGR